MTLGRQMKQFMDLTDQRIGYMARSPRLLLGLQRSVRLPGPPRGAAERTQTVWLRGDLRFPFAARAEGRGCWAGSWAGAR